MGISFGNFDEMCESAALIVCPLLGSDLGLQPVCYSRNVNLAGNIIFQPGECRMFRAGGRQSEAEMLALLALVPAPSRPLYARCGPLHGRHHGLPH